MTNSQFLKIPIDYFRAILPQGVPRTHNVIVQGPTRNEKDYLCYQLIKSSLIRGDAVLVVLSRNSVSEFRSVMKNIGVTLESYEKSGILKIVDWYSYKHERIIEIEEKDNILKCSKALTNVEIAISKALRILPKTNAPLAYIDVISPALSMFDPERIYKFAANLRAKFKRENYTALFSVEKEMHTAQVLSSLHGIFDGVIDFESVREEQKVITRVGILSMSGVTFSQEYREITFDPEKGIALKSPESIVPRAEQEIAGKKEFQPGRNYLVYEEKPDKTYILFSELVKKGLPGLCITSTFPSKIRETYNIETAQLYWLTDSSSEPGTLKPKRLDFEITKIIVEFMKSALNGIVLLDGFEYLVMENNFEAVKKIC